MVILAIPFSSKVLYLVKGYGEVWDFTRTGILITIEKMLQKKNVHDTFSTWLLPFLFSSKCFYPNLSH